MRILSLLGSPRPNGNSSTIANHFCVAAKRLGADVQTFALNGLTYRGCQGCMTCKTKLDKCVLKDELTEVLEAVRDTDILVLSSPVYFWDISSQLKGFIDRSFSYLVPDFITNPIKSRLEPGKKLVFILAQGNPDEGLFTNIFPKFEYFFNMFGFSNCYLIRACGVRDLGEVEGRQDVIKMSKDLAQELCGGH
jgi:multimeric flavodoxin WrbA